MRAPLRIKALRGRQRARLDSWYRQTHDARTRVRIQMVLLSADGYAITEIARITRQSPRTVRRWIGRFLHEGMAGLREEARAGRPAEVTPEVAAFLRTCLEQSPRAWGLRRPTWTTATLAKVVKRKFKIKLSDECIRQHLHRLDIVCRRPTWTVKHLAQREPGYAQKKGP